MKSTDRNQISRGQRVKVILKEDQEQGKLTAGIVQDILTKAPTHPRGIKVRLEDGKVGRVKEII